MTVARTVADVLTVTFEVECIDRMFLNVYQPKLQRRGRGDRHAQPSVTPLS